eukprot:Protomagalhaensia_sp_Gyna_25__2875@NODE_2678_length_948_cov_37_396040_g2234_i0_p1_GENE_NODE_2678_length_948_cov_37_396040_g2234_i0NODE_2678_length_948_cov_37_396040_g2234_i0_p1_ORF_typecomplete_len129_score14_79IMP2_N/PF18590_1/1_3e09_NODE_2678_length_948_cov_37_396040_g2234_i0258644
MGGACSTGSSATDKFMAEGYCYLIFDKSNGGTVSQQFTKSEISDYICMATPGSSIPNHKFQGTGKQAIKSRCAVSDCEGSSHLCRSGKEGLLQCLCPVPQGNEAYGLRALLLWPRRFNGSFSNHGRTS